MRDTNASVSLQNEVYMRCSFSKLRNVARRAFLDILITLVRLLRLLWKRRCSETRRASDLRGRNNSFMYDGLTYVAHFPNEHLIWIPPQKTDSQRSHRKCSRSKGFTLAWLNFRGVKAGCSTYHRCPRGVHCRSVGRQKKIVMKFPVGRLTF